MTAPAKYATAVSNYNLRFHESAVESRRWSCLLTFCSRSEDIVVFEQGDAGQGGQEATWAYYHPGQHRIASTS